MPITPGSPRVTASNLNLPMPAGLFEEIEGQGLMDLIKKLTANPEELTSKVNTGFSSAHFAKDLLSDIREYLTKNQIATEPGVNVFPLGSGTAKQLVYIGPKGDVIGGATVNELFSEEPGKFFTQEFAVDKSKGLLVGKAAASLGKKLLEMGAANIGGSISTDTYQLIQHLAKLVGK